MEDSFNKHNKEQSFLEYSFMLLWAKKFFIIKFCSVVLALSLVYILSVPRLYKSTVVMLPEIVSESGMSGSLGALASMAGVKLGGSSKDAISPEFYPKVLSSTPFMIEILSMKIALPESGEKVTLYDYLAFNQKTPWWHLSFLDDEKEAGNTRLDTLRLTKKQERIFKKMRKLMFCKVDKKTDLITLEVAMQDAGLASFVANAVQQKLQDYITEYRTQKLRNNLDYVTKVSEDAYKQYLVAQQEYVGYMDTHQDPFLTRDAQHGKYLENQMQLAYGVYSQSVQQKEIAKAKLQEYTPVFVTIQPGTVPLRPSEPKRVVFIFMMGVFSFFVSSIWILVKNMYLDRFLARIKPGK